MRAVLAFGALLLAASGFGQSLSMRIRPMFEGYEPSTGSTPLIAIVENSGPDAVGVIQIQNYLGGYEVPVDLPSGSRKTVPLYPQSFQYGSAFELSTNRGGILSKYEPSSTSAGTGAILAITDRPGEYAFLRSESTQGRRVISYSDAYCLPENAPGRMMAYQPFLGVILGSGSERLTDEAIAALRRYVTLGGKVVMVGGAGSQVVRDPRWLGMNAARIQGTREAYIPEIDNRGTVSEGQPSPGARKYGRAQPLGWSLVYGAGVASVLAFDPTESPFRESNIGRQALISAARIGIAAPAPYGHAPGAFAVTSAQDYGRYYSDWNEGPFGSKLPPLGMIAATLLLYFVVVIPLNFGILRLIKRGEWAWFTVPIISLAFAAFLFNSAQALYKYGQMTRSYGMLHHVSGEREALFQGTSEMFFPRSGRYDLAIERLEAVGDSNNSMSQPVKVVDRGSFLSVPAMQVTNLSYRSVGLIERVEAERFPKATRRGNRIRIENSTGAPMKNVSIRTATATQIAAGEIAPGKTAELNIASVPAADHPSLFVTAQWNGVTVGPQWSQGQANLQGVALRLYPVVAP